MKTRALSRLKPLVEQLYRLPKFLRSLWWFWLLAVGFIAFQVLLFFAVNSDFFAAGPENRTSPSSQYHPEPDIDVVVRLVGLSEATNSIQIAVQASVSGALKEEIIAGNRSIVVKVTSGFGDWGDSNIAVVKIDKNIPIRRGYKDALESEPVTGTVMAFRDVSPYPYDNYVTQLSFDVTDSSGYNHDLPFSTKLIKLIAGRRMEGEMKTSYLADIKLVRPQMQQIFVVFASGVYILIILGISVLLFTSPGKQTPQELIFASAGLLLGSVGFRDLIGLTKLTSFGAGDVLVIGIPLLCLTGALVKTALYGLREPLQRDRDKDV